MIRMILLMEIRSDMELFLFLELVLLGLIVGLGLLSVAIGLRMLLE